LLNAAVVEDGDAVGHRERLGLVVGHVDHRHPEPLVQVLDLELHVLAELLVEGAERFVHQHELRLKDKRTGERDALLLAARELRRAAAGEGAHLHHVDAALVRRDIVDRSSRQSNLAVRRSLKPCQHHQAGGLAGA